MKSSNPLVSIVIPVYNGSDFLREAIDSALAQTYPNIEIVVVNDGSNDDGATERVALSYGNKIRYFSKENGGVATALNTAIERMTGEYFSWLSHDDLYTPDKVEKQVSALSGMKDRDRVILYSDFAAFADMPDHANEVRLPSVAPENFRVFLAFDNSLHGCTLLIPRTAFDECGVFNEKLRTTQDYDLWFRLAEKYRFVHMPNVLVKARQHAAQGSVKMKDTAVAECNALLMRFISDLRREEITQASKQAASQAYANAAIAYWRRGFHQAAGYAARLSLRSLGEGGIGEGLASVAMLLKAVVFGAVITTLRRARDQIRARYPR